VLDGVLSLSKIAQEITELGGAAFLCKRPPRIGYAAFLLGRQPGGDGLVQRPGFPEGGGP